MLDYMMIIPLAMTLLGVILLAGIVITSGTGVRPDEVCNAVATLAWWIIRLPFVTARWLASLPFLHVQDQSDMQIEKDIHRHRLATGVILGAFVVAGTLVGETMPHVRNVTEVHRQVTRHIVRRIVHTTTIAKAVPPSEDLVAARRLCSGDPVHILNAEFTTYDDGNSKTWLLVEPVGQGAAVSCHVAGEYKEYKPGMTVRLMGALDNDPAKD